MRNDDFRHSYKTLLCCVWHIVKSEPHLQPMQGKVFALYSTVTDGDARLDGKAKKIFEISANQKLLCCKSIPPASRNLP